MDSDERLTDLKKAYASMILNTTKEAAARIIASERKALRLEYELKNTKEDAIKMLVRLKQMVDSKVSEAEMISRAQQNKIDELEAQLQEAEDIVKDLRDELRAVQAALEAKHTVHVNEASEKTVLDNPEYVYDQDQSNTGQRLDNALVPFGNSNTDYQDLPSIILRSKRTKKVYRSGITQRIHACPNKEKRILSPNDYQPLDQVNATDHVVEVDDELLTSPGFIKHCVEVCDVYRRIKEEPELVGCEKTKLPLMSEAQVDPPESKGSRVIKYTFQRKRKRGVLITDGNASSDNSKKKEENGNACLELLRVDSIEKSNQVDLKEVAEQLMSLADEKWWQ